jgi:hypothetical protein
MKKIIKLLSLASVFMAFTAHAEEIIKLEDNSRILGKWKIYAETPALHKVKKEVDNDWHFKKNGTLTAISRDPRIDAPKEVSVKYSIEDGVIRKQFQPGREKYENCSVVKLEGKDMIIHCSYNYYLMKRL